ncbi:hypothetical protein [Actinomadura macrotermitis]|uniref:hypothetical protein n=1 Tax=Actinomadura macrotermitis TaxID=2585200 RepID=UPI001295AA79|nr:hypothetical protein [Actinomadura macrotermitis]
MRAALAVLVAAVLTGCGGGGEVERVPVPAGFAELRTGSYAFAYPAGWRRGDDTDERGRPVLVVTGPVLPSGVTDGQVRLQRYDGRIGFADALTQFRGLARMNKYRITADRPVKVAGARRAQRFEASYELADGKGGSIPFKLLGVYAAAKDGVLVEFMLRAPEQGQASARLPDILASLRLKGD